MVIVFRRQIGIVLRSIITFLFINWTINVILLININLTTHIEGNWKFKMPYTRTLQLSEMAFST